MDPKKIAAEAIGCDLFFVFLQNSNNMIQYMLKIKGIYFNLIKKSINVILYIAKDLNV